MSKLINVLLFSFWRLNPSFSQTATLKSKNDINKHALIVAVWGNYRSIASINYERIFSNSKYQNIFLTSSIGVGILPGFKTQNLKLKSIKTIPILFSILVGKKKHFAEFGLGYTGAFGQNAIDSSTSPPHQFLKYESAYSINVGYRFMEYKGAMFVVTPLSLIWTNNKTSRFMYSFSFSIGSTF
jgi:hypothetical protein